jgi:hypothetical protein
MDVMIMADADINLERRLAAIRELLTDNLVDVEIAVADASGGESAAAMTAQVVDMYGNNLAKVCAFMIFASDTEFAGPNSANTNITVDTVTAGELVADGSAAGWWLVKTDATGLFAANANNDSDEEVFFNAASSNGGVEAGTGVNVRTSIPDSATWAA